MLKNYPREEITMKGKFALAMFALVLLFGASACNIKNENGGLAESTASEIIAQSTLYHNSFKDRIPEFKFDETPVEKYNDGTNYIFTVKCSEREFEKYVKRLKENGFDQKMVDETGYFYAYDSENYVAELTHIDGVLTAKIKKA